MITKKILKNFKKSKNFRLRRLWTKISPSSEGVGGKTGYLGLRSRSQLSRKQVFRMIGNVFRAENSITQKSTRLDPWGHAERQLGFVVSLKVAYELAFLPYLIPRWLRAHPLPD